MIPGLPSVSALTGAGMRLGSSLHAREAQALGGGFPNMRPDVMAMIYLALGGATNRNTLWYRKGWLLPHRLLAYLGHHNKPITMPRCMRIPAS